MKTPLLRFALLSLLLAVAGSLSGCVQFVDGLNQVAYQLDQENQRRAEAAAYDYYYYGRPAHDASAPGIK
jgi:hypothetical protein